MRLIRTIRNTGGSTRLIPLPTSVFRDHKEVYISHRISKNRHDLVIEVRTLPFQDGDLRPLYKIYGSSFVALPPHGWFADNKHNDIFNGSKTVVIDVEIIRNDSQCVMRVRPATPLESKRVVR